MCKNSFLENMEMKNAWDEIAKMFAEQQDDCEDCRFLATVTDAHPWGSTVAYESFRECKLLEKAFPPGLCQRYEKRQKEINETKENS